MAYYCPGKRLVLCVALADRCHHVLWCPPVGGEQTHVGTVGDGDEVEDDGEEEDGDANSANVMRKVRVLKLLFQHLSGLKQCTLLIVLWQMLNKHT